MERPIRRVFAAIVPPLAVREDLARRLAAASDVRWTPAPNMHVTLVFEPACADVPELITRLGSAVAGHRAFRLRIGGAGSFQARRGYTLWMAARGAIEADQTALRAVRVAVGARADAVGHLTLARVRESVDTAAALATIAALPTHEWPVEEVWLYESVLAGGPDGRSRYDPLARFPLAPTPGPPRTP
ncbi:2'-5' RNA ligase family protein [Tomitella biformata]|uniref:2'-5' RNA ligase family protein n=1 Tax=Tomitella biformata TaxID=630403 RepID=UPI0006889D70|nr:2'-5' RNA ligase family protein [Tomitella biformata]